MAFHKKIKSWIVDYGYLLRGTASMIIHKNPPKHYLGYIVSEKVPVILIPGILGKWSFLKHLGDRISLIGHPVYIFPELGYNLYDIPSSANKLKALLASIIPGLEHPMPDIHRGAERLKKLVERENIKGAILVAHSKGGLIGKYFLIHHNFDNRVLGLIAIAAPFAGSAMVKLLPIKPKSFKELDVDSQIIKDIEDHKDINKKIVSIIPEYDNHVWAEKRSFLDGATNIEVPVHGHHKVIFSKEVEKAVIESIEKITSRA